MANGLQLGDAYGATLGRMKGPSGGRRAWHGYFDDVDLSLTLESLAVKIRSPDLAIVTMVIQ